MGKEIKLMDLWDVDMGKAIVHEFADVKKSAELFWFLLKIAIAPRGSVGTFQASSFFDRINECANLVVTTGNTALDPEEANILVVLKINREFMGFRREHYPGVANQHMRMAVLAAVDN